MIIKRIDSIDNYKSFFHYCHLNSNNKGEDNGNFKKINILYGENASGKSTIVSIIKSLSSYKELVSPLPKNIIISSDLKKYTYYDEKWNDNIPKEDIFYFDNEFIAENIHKNRERTSDKKGTEQNSANLIIEYDKEAISKREIKEDLKRNREEIKNVIKKLEEENNNVLSFSLSPEDLSLYNTYKQCTAEQIDEIKNEKSSNLVPLTQKRDSVIVQKTNKDKINDIVMIPVIYCTLQFSEKERYKDLFCYNLKEKTTINAKAELIDTIKIHKEVYDYIIKYRKENDLNICPICHTPDSQSHLSEIIELYTNIYDDTYEKQKIKYNTFKSELLLELELIKNSIDSIDISSIFLSIRGIYEIGCPIYEYQKEVEYNQKIINITTHNIEKMIEIIEKLEPDAAIEFDEEIYNKIKREVEIYSDFIVDFNTYIDNINDKILYYKKKVSELDFDTIIATITTEISDINNELSFLNTNKIMQQKMKEAIQENIKDIQSNYDEIHEEYIKNKKIYDEYCNSEVFINITKKIQEYFSYFNFDFQLEFIKRSGAYKECPFSFHIVDTNGKNRDFKDGLSEGELQVLSVCFFFAFLDIQDRKDEKILILDDPITSLDSSNLHHFTELIHEQTKYYSQMFIFTHNTTFHKYIKNRFGNNAALYYVIKNSESHGGSFICNQTFPSRNDCGFIDKLQNIEKIILEHSMNPNGYDMYKDIIIFGQYFRIEIEFFVKCKLLHWGDTKKFDDLIKGIKNNKHLTDEDLDTICSLYSFCNWSNTSHVDIDENTAMTQLKNKINVFLKIYEKYHV